MKHLFEYHDLSQPNSYLIKDQNGDDCLDMEELESDLIKALPYFKSRIKLWKGRPLTDDEFKDMIGIYVETQDLNLREYDLFGRYSVGMKGGINPPAHPVDKWKEVDLDVLADDFTDWMNEQNFDDWVGI